MLQLSCCIGFAMDIGNFLQLQASFHGNGIIQAPSYEEGVMDIGELGSKPLDSAFVFKNSLDFGRNGE